MAFRSTAVSSSCRTPPRVLVAEDHTGARRQLSRALREAGYDVTELTDGVALWNELLLLKDPDVKPDPHAEPARDADLIVTDVRLPGAGGLEIVQRLRASGWGTAVILVSAIAHLSTPDVVPHGAVPVFHAPFDVERLVDTARSLVNPTV